MALELSKPVQYFITLFVIFHAAVFVFVSVRQFNRTNQLRKQYDTENTRMLLLEQECENTKMDFKAIIDELEEVTGHINPDIKTFGLRQLTKRQTMSMEVLFQELLQAQMHVLEQHCTNNSHICVRGINGDTGKPGVKGQPGGKGDIGDKGNNGPDGPHGSRGDIGESGSSGYPGIKGIPGISGKSGQIGAKGEIGIVGIQGDKGDRGLQGQKGVKGVKGLPGHAGVIGERGDPGQKGLKGDQGLPGEKGEKGQTGPRGPSGNVTDSDCLCVINVAPPMLALSTTTKVPSTTILPQNKTVNSEIGKRISFHCDEGESQPTNVHWVKKGETLNSRIIISGAVLEIPEVYKIDNGTYECVTHKSNGETVAQTFTLNVLRGSNYDCNFEAGLCRWTQSKTDRLDWTQNQGGTKSGNTGPMTDHTIGGYPGGHYIYLETSYGFYGYRADLLSPYFSPHHTYCLDFWYNMHGNDVNELAIYSQEGQNLSKIWSMAGNQGNDWHQGNVTLAPASVSYQLVFRATRGRTYSGDIAIDDIILLDGPCNGASG